MEMATGLDKWWTYLLRGILALIFGVIILVWPGATVLVLIILFGCYVLVEGLFAVGFSIAKASKGEKWVALLLLGILGIIVGLAVLVRPGAGTLAVLIVFAIWLVIRGFLMLISAFEMSGAASVRWLVGISGALALILGILMLIFPISGVFGVILVIGIYSLVAGVFLAISSFYIKKIEESGPDTLAAA
ncbi:MAG: HdeD family acid-resistance protein [Candidatus Geothermincolia bacterium]